MHYHVLLDTYEEDICERQNILSNNLGDISFHIISLCKNFISSATILSTISALIAYTILANLEQIDIMNPYVLTALLLGAAIPYIYGASILGIVSKTARRLGVEVKKQLKRAPQILRYEIRPDYEKCCDISAVNSCIQVIFHTFVILLVFFFVAKVLNIEALMGFVFGVMLSSIGLIFSTNASSVLAKSARRCFEEQFNCVKNTDEYNAINLNEAIFAAFKDLINPALNALIKLLAILALVLVPMFM